jgi:hypothetical protein
MNVRRRFLLGLPLVVLLAVVPGFAGETKSATQTAASGADRDLLEKQFAEKMTGSALVGRFSIEGQDADKPPHPERYEIERVTKLRDDYWTFVARIKYADKDVNIPVTVQILWAGDTPVITLTDLTIPGLGSFTTRLLIYGDRYAGTWQHGKYGGHMWGTIEKSAESSQESRDGTGSGD